MLVLTRKNGQKLILNDNIEIVVIESSNNNVKIGINAPRDVSIYREEIWREIKDTNKVAPKTTFSDLDKLSAIVKEKSSNDDAKFKNVVNKIKM